MTAGHLELTHAEAAEILARLDASPTLVHAAQAARRFDALAEAVPHLPLKLACLASFTFDPIGAPLRLQGLLAGFRFDLHIAAYNQFEQALIDPQASLASFAPDAVLLAVRLQDVCPAIYDGFNGLGTAEAQGLIDDWLQRLRSALTTFRQRSTARILLQNYDLPAAPALGIADSIAPASQSDLIGKANLALRELQRHIDNLHVMDYDALVAGQGRRRWTDPRTALYARIPVAPAHYWALAGFYVRHLRPLYGLSKKVLVLDADHTLWGGVVGDVGLGGIALGPDYPGNAYVAFQKRVLDLHRRGVLLCLASKNEPATVQEVIEKHPAMILRGEHFAAQRVNWLPKHENLQEMARELNLGLDSFVFVDDSPVECEWVRSALPQVLSVCLPKEPAEYPGVIERLDCFDQWQISAEDRRRGEMYRAESGRRALQSAVVDMPTFYRQLQMTMTLAVDDPADVARAAQMTVRTNQFNMHTIRCTEDDIRRFMQADDCQVITLALTDRFGDYGVIGLAVMRKAPRRWTIHQLLMSCRVLGRGVEQCFVKRIAQSARQAGASELVGEFAMTPKNKPFADFYGSCGFVEGPASGDVRGYTWALDAADTTIPDWMTLVIRNPPQRL